MGWCYEIMHLDKMVAQITSDGSCQIADPAFLPWNLYLEEDPGQDISIRLNNLTNFYYWCASRVLTPDRVYAKEVLNAIGATQSASIDKSQVYKRFVQSVLIDACRHVIRRCLGLLSPAAHTHA